MKNVKWRELLLAAVLILTMCIPQTAMAQENMLFADPANEDYAKLLDKLGIYSFYSDAELFFEDNKDVTRIEAAKSLVSLLGHDITNAKGSVSHLFIDVPDYYEGAGVVNIAVNLGLMRGVDTGIFAPEDTIKLEHFIKSMVIALGYDFKAQVKGGYPFGYITVANELELLDGVSATYSDALTREMLIRILYNSLDVEISLPVSVGGEYAEYQKADGITVLTEYHDIYTEEDVVNSNNVLSLKSYFKPSDEKVLVGEEQLYADTADIFAYVGQRIKCYYKLIEEEKHLVYFEVLSDNNIYSFASYEVLETNTNEITAEDDSGDELTVDISTNADVFCNGILLQENIGEKMKNFADKITLIDNDNDDIADVVFIEDYTYDQVDYVDLARKTLYLKDKSVSISDKDFISVTNESGVQVDIESLSEGTIVGIGSEADSNILMIKVIGLPQSVTVESITDNEITSTEGESYYIHSRLSEKMRSNIKSGQSAAVAVSDTNTIVWADKGTEAVKIGFLIDAASNTKGLETEAMVRILATDSVVTEYYLEDKIRINDTTVEKEDVAEYLKQTKASLNTGADSETAQVVYYMTDETGKLKRLYTAGKTEGSKLVMKYNYNEMGEAFLRDHGYGSAVYASGYALSDKVPIFQVPLEDIGSYEDKYFTTVKYSPTLFKDGSKCKFESYVADSVDIVPTAMVYYKTATAEIDKGDDFFLIEKVTKVLDTDGEAVVKLTGYSYNSKVSYLVDSGVTLPELSPGDIGIFSLDTINNINNFEKVYDYDTDTVNPDYVGSSRGDTIAVRVLHVYNAPTGSDFIETYEGGFENGIPGDEDKVLFNFIPYNRTKRDLFSFDIKKKEGKLQGPDKIIDYLHDSENYARIVIRFGNNYQGDAVFYQ